MRILVCGGRDFGKKFEERIWIINQLDTFTFTHLIQGGASGVDTCARTYAISHDLPYTEYPAQWGKYSKSAGFIRNKQMLDEGKPDLVVAFPGGRGTKMMIELAQKAGVPVREFKYETQ